MTNAAWSYSKMASSKIDAQSGIIEGVSVITVGEAAGKHSGTWIDRTTLSQINEVAKKYPDGIKVKLSQAKEHDGSVGQVVGVLRNFRIDGDQERADLHLLKSGDKFSQIIEMAQIMPSEFGFSVVIPKEIEKVGGKECLRCSEIYSVDLVEAPAANPSGLFSRHNPEKSMSIKYKEGNEGPHHDECECRECMSKHSKKSMSAMFAKFIGLSENATEQEIESAMKTKFSSGTGEVADLTKKLTDVTAELSAIKTQNANAVALSKKAEIDNLMAEASRNGQVVPLDNAELYEVKDGVCKIHMEPTQLSKIISRIPKNQLAFSRNQKPIEAPKNADGKTFDRRTPEGREELRKWCLSKQRENAPEIIRASRSQTN